MECYKFQVSFTKRLTYWVASPYRAPLYGRELRYRRPNSDLGTAQLMVRNEARFVELIMRDTGEDEYAIGMRGDHGAGRYFELDDETEVDDILESLCARSGPGAALTHRPRSRSVGAFFCCEC